MKNIFHNKISIFFSPFISAIVLFGFLFRGIQLTGYPRFSVRSLVAAGVIVFLWAGVFIFDQIRIRKHKKNSGFIACHVFIAMLFAIMLSLYSTFAIWGSGYLCLAPFERIDNGTAYLDTLFHSAISESFRFGLPSTLLNEGAYIHYHTFSHLVVFAFSRIINIPAYICYNYFFPILMIPIYIYAQLAVIISAKHFFMNTPTIRLSDIIIVHLFNTGFLHKNFLNSYGVWKKDFFISESFLVANTLVLLFYSYCFYFLLRKCKSRFDYIVFTIVSVILVFVISWSKISVGLLVAGSLIYYAFRTGARNIKNWIFIFFIMAIMLLAMYCFMRNQGSPIANRIVFGAFGIKCTGFLGIWGHYILLALSPTLFVVGELVKKKYPMLGSCNRIFVEEVIIICMVSFLPGLLMDISGGSAVYFSFFAEIATFPLLCGQNLICNITDRFSHKRWSMAIKLLCICWCILLTLTNRETNPIKEITYTHITNTSELLLKLRDAVEDNVREYSVYIDDNSFVTKPFTQSPQACYVIPAMTGIGVINATYELDGTYYMYSGDVIKPEMDYDLRNTRNRSRLTLSEAGNAASMIGKKYLLYLTDGYEQINCLK